MQAAGFVLVGGQSTRMGRDKALLSAGAEPLVAAVAREVRAAAGTVALVGQPERYAWLGFDCLPDLRGECGPMAGLEAALLSARAEWNLVVACDMPGLAAAPLRALVEQAQRGAAPCVVTQDVSGKMHPLCAVYRASCLPAIRRALDEGRLRLMNLIAELDAAVLPSAATLANVNTPKDWNEWQKTRR